MSSSPPFGRTASIDWIAARRIPLTWVPSITVLLFPFCVCLIFKIFFLGKTEYFVYSNWEVLLNVYSGKQHVPFSVNDDAALHPFKSSDISNYGARGDIEFS